jgi:hypothetical protein
MTALRYESIRAETGKTARALRGRYVGAVGALLLLAALGGSMVCAAGPVHTSRAYWIGKNVSEAEKEFGRPTFSEQLIETGGKLVIYAGEKNPIHFVFETEPGGKIVKAARVK